MFAYESIKMSATLTDPAVARAKQKESNHFTWYWRILLEHEGRIMEFDYQCGAAWSLYKPDATGVFGVADSKNAFLELANGHKPFGYAGREKWLATGRWEKLPHGHYLNKFMVKGSGMKLIGRTFEEQCELLRQVLKPTVPSLKDVIYSVVSDYECVQYNPTFEEFCAELGYNSDSIKHKEIYEACRDQSMVFKRLIGDSKKLERICTEARVLDDMYNATPEEQLAEINDRLGIREPTKAVAADFGF